MAGTFTHQFDRTARQVVAPRQLLTSLAITAATLIALLTVHLVFRRLSGVLVQPLGGLAIVAVAIALATISAMLRLWLASRHSVPGTQSSVLWVAPGVAALLVLIALTIPGTPVWGTAVAWLVVVGSEAASWLLFLNPSIARTHGFVPLPTADAAPLADEEPEVPAGLVQQMTRVRQDEGESIQALVHCQFATGDRLSVAHLAFCPPLAMTPKLTAHAIDNPTAEVRITQAETYGARIEVRVSRVEDAVAGVVIEVLGSAAGPRSGSATAPPGA